MFIKKNTLTKKEKETFIYYQNVTRIYRWLVNILLLLSWSAFAAIIVFLMFYKLTDETTMWIFYPFWISFGISVFFTFCTSFWYFYLCTYRTIMINKFLKKKDTHFKFFVFVIYFITKWIAFGWWIAKKYNYKKELKHLKRDLNS